MSDMSLRPDMHISTLMSMLMPDISLIIADILNWTQFTLRLKWTINNFYCIIFAIYYARTWFWNKVSLKLRHTFIKVKFILRFISLIAHLRGSSPCEILRRWYLTFLLLPYEIVPCDSGMSQFVIFPRRCN